MGSSTRRFVSASERPRHGNHSQPLPTGRGHPCLLLFNQHSDSSPILLVKTSVARDRLPTSRTRTDLVSTTFSTLTTTSPRGCQT
jgi:hypothetical protein